LVADRPSGRSLIGQILVADRPSGRSLIGQVSGVLEFLGSRNIGFRQASGKDLCTLAVEGDLVSVGIVL
jgi:hypothetical protein